MRHQSMLLTLAAAALAGCTASDEKLEWAHHTGGKDYGFVKSPVPEGGMLAIMPRETLTSLKAAALEEARAAGAAPASPKRLVIYTARFEILVASAEDALERFVRKVEALGGHLQRREDNAVTCRVPAERFQALVAEIPSFGAVISRSQEALDVTKDHQDIAIRIENAERQRKRLLALLDKAEKMEDILKIEADLRRLTEEIERMQGEIKSLEDRIAYSAIEVVFRSSAPEPRAARSRRASPFDWINRIGPENLLGRY
jgi:hypothetical protein